MRKRPRLTTYVEFVALKYPTLALGVVGEAIVLVPVRERKSAEMEAKVRWICGQNGMKSAFDSKVHGWRVSWR